MKKLLIALGVIIVVIVLIVILRKDKGEEVENFVIGQADVTSVSTSFEESFPLGVRVSVQGTLPDACTELGDVIQTKDETSGDFIVTLETKRPLDAVCAEVLSDFDTSFTLEGTNGLVQGDYGVVVNGVRTTFTLEVDNFISDLDTLK
jgi:hypothetical protein